MNSAEDDDVAEVAMPRQQQQQQPDPETVKSSQTPPTKSCLSRHNSTHHSIKKKVNISNRAEIIEPEPSPISLLLLENHNNNNNILIDDDEVFSDSLPPPKRESMCAPYIDADLLPETMVFAHGLPSWFDDERLNEMWEARSLTLHYVVTLIVFFRFFGCSSIRFYGLCSPRSKLCSSVLGALRLCCCALWLVVAAALSHL